VFLIFLLSLMLIAVLHMYVSVEDEWHASSVLSDKELLELHHFNLSAGYSRIIVLILIILTVVCVFGAWFVF